MCAVSASFTTAALLAIFALPSVFLGIFLWKNRPGFALVRVRDGVILEPVVNWRENKCKTAGDQHLLIRVGSMIIPETRFCKLLEMIN